MATRSTPRGRRPRTRPCSHPRTADVDCVRVPGLSAPFAHFVVGPEQPVHGRHTCQVTAVVEQLDVNGSRGLVDVVVAQSREALEVPARDEGVRWAEEAIERVLLLTEGLPYFLQEFGKQAWDAAEGPDAISLDDVERSIPVATAQLDDGFFRVRAGRTSNPERAYLRAMAEFGPGPVRSSAVAQLLGKKVTALGPTRDGLIRRALCYSPRWGEIAFTVPMFDRFMKRWIPDVQSVLGRSV